MRVYLAGPMTGLPHNNTPAFEQAYDYLERRGLEVVLPPGMSTSDDVSYRDVLPKDIVAMATCDAVVLLPGYEQSRGVGLEVHAADLFEMPVFAPGSTDDWADAEHDPCLDDWLEAIVVMIAQHLLDPKPRPSLTLAYKEPR